MGSDKDTKIESLLQEINEFNTTGVRSNIADREASQQQSNQHAKVGPYGIYILRYI